MTNEVVQTVRCSDVVLHRPTGERWTVAYYDGRDLVPCGWPLTFARLEDCDVLERAGDAEHWSLVREMAGMGGDDPRGRWARGQLEVDHAAGSPQTEGRP